MSAVGAAVLSSMAGWIDGQLGDEHADRQTICEDVAAQLRDMAAALRESGEAGGIPAGYQLTLRQGLADAIMFRQARAAGGDDSDQAGLYRTVARALGLPLPEELPAAGVLLDEDQAATAAAALDDAVAGIRDRAAHCGECAASPADLCDGCADRLARVELYAGLAAALCGAR